MSGPSPTAAWARRLLSVFCRPIARPFRRTIDRCNTFRPWRHFGDYVDKVFAGPKRLLPGLGGDAHQSWRAGDIFCHRTAGGKCLLFGMIDRVEPFVQGAPIVTLLDWNHPNPDGHPCTTPGARSRQAW